MLASFQSSTTPLISAKLRLGAALSHPRRTRVAPSPTGHVHLGTMRTALHNALVARASGGSWSLRIDDTDQARNNQVHVDLIHACLDRLDLHPDYSFHQSQRRDAHLSAAQALLDSGLAVRDGHCIRMAPGAGCDLQRQFFDLAAGGCVISDTFMAQADGLVLVRSDGMPTYHFASVVDDIDHGINLILRGMDHLANVAKQMRVARVLAQAGWPGARDFCDQVLFAHVGLILKDGKKLSKRDGASNLMAYFDQGVGADALLQWGLMLGWGHPDPQFDKQWPCLGMDDMPAVFSQGGLRSSNCAMDVGKLAALQRKWAARQTS